MNDFFNKIYSKPYTRMGPYLVGLVLAYYVHRRKRSNAHSLNWVSINIITERNYATTKKTSITLNFFYSLSIFSYRGRSHEMVTQIEV